MEQPDPNLKLDGIEWIEEVLDCASLPSRVAEEKVKLETQDQIFDYLAELFGG